MYSISETVMISYQTRKYTRLYVRCTHFETVLSMDSANWGNNLKCICTGIDYEIPEYDITQMCSQCQIYV